MRTDDPTTVTCPETLDIAVAEDFYPRLCAALQAPGTVRLELDAVGRVDAAGVQLLWAFVRDLRSAGRNVEWAGRSTALAKGARLLGLGGRLELPAGE